MDAQNEITYEKGIYLIRLKDRQRKTLKNLEIETFRDMSYKEFCESVKENFKLPKSLGNYQISVVSKLK